MPSVSWSWLLFHSAGKEKILNEMWNEITVIQTKVYLCTLYCWTLTRGTHRKTKVMFTFLLDRRAHTGTAPDLRITFSDITKPGREDGALRCTMFRTWDYLFMLLPDDMKQSWTDIFLTAPLSRTRSLLLQSLCSGSFADAQKLVVLLHTGNYVENLSFPMLSQLAT